ncbi:MAG: glycosyltransferase, partial [Chloroflexota bacterium]
DPVQQIKQIASTLESNAEPTGVLPTVSVVIPTINRPQMLATCLRSLEKLNDKPLEIIVVDNDPATSISAEVVAQFPQVTYLAQPRTGASQARNLGVQHSSGEIVAFVDDDEEVHSDWLTHLIQAFNRPEIACTTGLVLPCAIETEAQDFFESRFSFVRGYRPVVFAQTFFEQRQLGGVPVWDIGGSGNMAVRREIFLRLGGFDERLGGGHAGCSEDTEFFYRLLNSGWEISYAPRAICFHDHRIDREGLKRQIYSYMRGHVTALLVQFLKTKNANNLTRLFCVLPFVYLKYLMLGLLQDQKFPFWTLRLEILGCLSGFVYFWQNRRFWQTTNSYLTPLDGRQDQRTTFQLGKVELENNPR